MAQSVSLGLFHVSLGECMNSSFHFKDWRWQKKNNHYIRLDYSKVQLLDFMYLFI